MSIHFATRHDTHVIVPWNDPRSVLRRFSYRPERRHSQNFLVSERACRAIAHATLEFASAPDSVPHPHIVELGPGCGTLTQLIVPATHAPGAAPTAVTVIERDPRMLEILRALFADAENLTIIDGDAGELDLGSLAGGTPRAVTLVGNLPYHITGLILGRVLEGAAFLNGAVIMVQREVAQRILAPEGVRARGALSVLTAARFDVCKLMHVPRTSFHPPPKVDSTVVTLTPHDRLDVDFAVLERVVAAAFAAKRKTLRNSLAGATGGEATDVARWLNKLGIAPERRAETLTLAEFVHLAQAWATFPERHER